MTEIKYDDIKDRIPTWNHLVCWLECNLDKYNDVLNDLLFHMEACCVDPDKKCSETRWELLPDSIRQAIIDCIMDPSNRREYGDMHVRIETAGMSPTGSYPVTTDAIRDHFHATEENPSDHFLRTYYKDFRKGDPGAPAPSDVDPEDAIGKVYLLKKITRLEETVRSMEQAIKDMSATLSELAGDD